MRPKDCTTYQHRFFSFFSPLSFCELIDYYGHSGFGDDLLKEEKTIADLVNVLKNEIRYVHVFILAFKQTDNRMTYALRSMISLFEKGRRRIMAPP
jgi:hypothetical protein